MLRARRCRRAVDRGAGEARPDPGLIDDRPGQVDEDARAVVGRRVTRDDVDDPGVEARDRGPAHHGVRRAVHAGPQLRQRHDRIAGPRDPRSGTRDERRRDGGDKETGATHRRRHSSAGIPVRCGDGRIAAMLSRETVQHWLDDYVAAWRSYDPEAIRALFAPQVTYAYHPWDEPLARPGRRRRLVAREPRRARLVAARRTRRRSSRETPRPRGRDPLQRRRALLQPLRAEFDDAGAAPASSSGTCSGPN